MPLTTKQKHLILPITCIRLIAPLFIFINPKLGIVLALLSDLIDHRPLVKWNHLPRENYQIIDKYLDFYWYTIIIAYTLIVPPPINISLLIIVTFLYRLLGVIVFSITKNEHLLLYFPNIMEHIFWSWIFAPILLSHDYIILTMITITLIKIYIEKLIHVDNFNPLDSLKILTHLNKKFPKL